MVYTIKKITAREILDSRGNPTLEVKVILNNGIEAIAGVPSGASTGKHEAIELRDGNKKRYEGKGVKKAIKSVNKISKELKGLNITSQSKIDRMMIVLDGTPNKSKLGANSIVGVSMAIARAAALALELPLYQYLRRCFKLNYENEYKLPIPLVNVFNGGSHADTNMDIQEIWVIPYGINKFKERVRVASEIFHQLKKVLKEHSLDSDVGDEGGYAPDIASNEQSMSLLTEAINEAGYKLGEKIGLGMDVAASEFFDSEKNLYMLSLDKKNYSSREMIGVYNKWLAKYHIVAIEDGLAEDDWQGWKYMTAELGDKIDLIGDDLFVTNTTRLRKGIKEKVANSILIKVNQVGTVTETIQCIKLAQREKYKLAISHRSGETSDTFISDLAVAVNAEYIKTGSMSRSERTSKYNRLMEIEDELAKKED